MTTIKKSMIGFVCFAIMLLSSCSAKQTGSQSTTQRVSQYSIASQENDIIAFYDENVESTVRKLLRKTPEDSINKEDMLSFEDFSFAGYMQDGAEPGEDFRISIIDLRNAKNLTKLALWDCDIQDLTPLNSISGLRSLRLSGCTLSNLSLLAPMEELEEVSLYRSFSADSLAFLSNSVKLNHLDITYTSICDISPLAGTEMLEVLKAAYVPINDFSALKGLKNLKYLLCSASDEDIPVLSELKSLEELCLIDSFISEKELSGLQKALPNTTIVVS